ncbi:MAG: hypothetical protein AABX66_00575, partial [Nanoarchaeota archaeon]
LFLNSSDTPQLAAIGLFILADGVYETLGGFDFTRKELESITERDLTLKEVKDHPMWLALSRNPALLNEYSARMFDEMKQRFGQGNTNYDNNMGVYLASAEKVPTLRASYVCRLEFRSQLGGWDYLDNDGGRLVGVAPEALGAPNSVIVRPSLAEMLESVNSELGKGNLELRAK